MAMMPLLLFVLFVDTTTAFMVGVRMPSCSSAMVESWYDAKMAAEAEAVTASPPAGTANGSLGVYSSIYLCPFRTRRLAIPPSIYAHFRPQPSTGR